MNLVAGTVQSWKTICCRRQEGPWNGCVSQAWFMIGCSLKLSPFRAWVLFDFSGLCLLREWKKEKIQRKRWDLRENEGKKEKKNVVKLKEKKHLPLKTKTFLPYCGVAVERRTKFLKKVPLHNNFWRNKNVVLVWIRGKKRATQHFFFRKGLHSTQWITF